MFTAEKFTLGASKSVNGSTFSGGTLQHRTLPATTLQVNITVDHVQKSDPCISSCLQHLEECSRMNELSCYTTGQWFCTEQL